jgi:hypothetical protein
MARAEPMDLGAVLSLRHGLKLQPAIFFLLALLLSHERSEGYSKQAQFCKPSSRLLLAECFSPGRC